MHLLFRFEDYFTLVIMLTNKLISYYNQLLATTVLYVTLVDPLQELSESMKQNTDSQHIPGNLVMAATNDHQQDYYETLGVKKDATKHEIHRAFRQLAKKYHPDKNKEKSAQDEFIKIFKAYETLSDEKKRKEYDNRNSGSNSFHGWQTNGMNDFDINEFFKQYEEQFVRHAQHFNDHHHAHQHAHQHNHHHNQFFHGVNLDDLFHDIDEDEFSSFGRMFDFSGGHNHPIGGDTDGSFGDGASFFGSHFSEQLYDTLNQHGFGQHYSADQGSYSCHTTTKQVNGVLMTQTSCA